MDFLINSETLQSSEQAVEFPQRAPLENKGFLKEFGGNSILWEIFLCDLWIKGISIKNPIKFLWIGSKHRNFEGILI